MKNSKALLCIGLLGSVIVSFGILFSKSYVAMAEDEHSFSRFFYEGIESITENVYSIDFWNKNVMFVTGGENSIFHMSNIPVIIKNANNVISGGISNILGGYNVQLWNSNNITVIGGESKVDGGNTNATLFGGQGNLISGSMSSDTPTVLLGGVNNVVDAGHDANAIVGGASNFIGEDSKNVNILGGTSISIDGNDVIAGGQQLRGEISDSFVFSDGNYDGIMDLEGSGMFFLNVANGVGLGILTQQGNQGVVSNGAVNVGYVDIDHTNCTQSSSENIGLMGVWNGCMVGCTSGSAMQSKWEMLGYGDLCEHLCDSSDKCIVHPVNPWNIDYTSFCTEGLVNTGNASMCPNLSLGAYHNVMFETYLIDSDAGCPTTGYNQCVYRCNSDSHLLKDETGKKGRKTMCYRDCQMPGNSGVMKKHNEVITAYSTGDTYCSNEPGNHDSCANYKKQLMCVDGTWYEMNGNEVTDTINTIYNYDSCTLHDYTCSDEFSLTRENIVNDKKDFVEIWRYGNTNSLLSDFVVNKIITPHLGFVQYSDIERNDDEPQQEAGATQMGIRGKYTLCIQYDPVTTPSNQYPGNEEGCVESSPLPEQYRYRFDECNEGYELADDGVCRKLCEYDGKLIQHGSGIVLYSGSYATCPSTCEENSKQFICYDGTLYADLQVGENGGFTSGVAQNSTPYTQTGCTVECPQCGPANGKEYETLPTLEYILCTGSTLSGGVTTTETEFTWTCMTGHSSVNCSAIHGNNFTYEDLDIYFLTDEGNIGNYTLMDRNLGATAYMGESGKSKYDWNGNYYQWGNNYGFPNVGQVNKSTTKVTNASNYGPSPKDYYSRSTFVLGAQVLDDWANPSNNDLRGDVTDSLAARQGPCPTNYHVPAKNEFENIKNYWLNSVYNKGGRQRSLDSLMPFASFRGALNANIDFNEGARYWSSSPVSSEGCGKCAYLITFSAIDSNGFSVWDRGRAHGFSVRCFKNLPNNNLTIHPNGGTRALIIVHGDEITKLGTPHKGSETFGGWYWDEEYTLKAETGQTVSAPANLYAKWISNECDGALPSGNGVLTGSTTYPNGYTTTGWTYKVNGELGACEWRCSDGYIKGNNNTCVDNICANNHSDFKDLDMYFITNAGATGHYTLMDRNLGATAYMGEDGKLLNDWNGCHYQWGNNYGFPNQGSIQKKNINIRTEGYSWRNPYVSDIFLTTVTSPGASDWSTPNNYDLWGDTTNTLEARQGPCPEGYHVPTNGEFKDIINNYWKKSANYTSSNIATQRGLDSLMPFAGDRDPFTAGIGSQGSWGFYWSSSHRDYKDSNMLLFYNTTLSAHDSVSEPRSAGLSVRCFKNSKNSLLTIDTKGGTGALIIVHGDEITKLGTPHKGSETFGGWYWDSGYTSKAKTGDKISAPAYLYAKWGCAEGYVQSGDNCVVVYNCGGETPDGNNMSRGNFEAYSQTSWTYKAEGELGACEWRCHEGYIQSGNTCTEANYECEGDDPMFDNTYTEVVALINPATAEGQQKMIYRNLTEAQAYSCSYVCTGDYEFLPNPNRCVRCLEGSEERENGVLVACSEIIDACDENHHYVAETHQCVAYGNCTWKGGVKNNIPENANITDMSLVRPIGVNKEWNCKTDEANVNPNECQFACTGDFICRSSNDNYPGCTTLSCSYTNKNGRFYAEKSENPVQLKSSGYPGPNGGRWYGEGRKYLESENTGHFQSQVENKPGCYFWCPEELLCRLDYYRKRPTDYESNWTCYASVEAKENDCVEVQEYECSGVEYHILHGNVTFDTTAYGQDREFQIFYTPGEYRNHISEGCYRGCQEGSTLIESEEYGPICWKQCSQNQYFNITNRSLASPCRSCSDWQKPNTGNLFNGSPISCIDKCDEGRQWGENYGVGGGEGCILGVVSANDCPEGTDYTVLENNQIKCVHNL